MSADHTKMVMSKVCGRSFSHKSSTSTLRYHISKVHSEVLPPSLPFSTQSELRRDLVLFLSLEHISKRVVEREHVHRLMGDGVSIPRSHQTIFRCMRKLPLDLLKRAFPSVSSPIFCNLCFDGWTDPTGRHMYGLVYRGEDHASPVALRLPTVILDAT